MAEYIEREATLNVFRNLGSRDYRREKGTIADAMKMIMNPAYTPTADVVEVLRGNWIPFYESEISGFNPELAGHDPISGYKCSGCGAEAILDCNDQFVLSNYCPNCGAKMDGGDK